DRHPERGGRLGAPADIRLGVEEDGPDMDSSANLALFVESEGIDRDGLTAPRSEPLEVVASERGVLGEAERGPNSAMPVVVDMAPGRNSTPPPVSTNPEAHYPGAPFRGVGKRLSLVAVGGSLVGAAAIAAWVLLQPLGAE